MTAGDWIAAVMFWSGCALWAVAAGQANLAARRLWKVEQRNRDIGRALALVKLGMRDEAREILERQEADA